MLGSIAGDKSGNQFEETADDIYTTVDWRVVYETVSQFIKQNFQANNEIDEKSDNNNNNYCSVKYDKQKKSLLCKISGSSFEHVEFSFTMYESPKWSLKPSINSNNSKKVYVVKMQRFKGNSIDFNNI